MGATGTEIRYPYQAHRRHLLGFSRRCRQSDIAIRQTPNVDACCLHRRYDRTGDDGGQQLNVFRQEWSAVGGRLADDLGSLIFVDKKFAGLRFQNAAFLFDKEQRLGLYREFLETCWFKRPNTANLVDAYAQLYGKVF